MRRLAIAVTVSMALLFESGAGAGTVVTTAARQNGTIVLQADSVQVGSVQVKWADVLVAFNDWRGNKVLPPEVIHLKNGESWAGEIVKLADGKATLSTTWFGKRDLPGDMLRAVDFKSHLPPVQAGESMVLHRTKGSPVEGSLLWIEGDRIALKTPLGVLALTRKDMQRAVYEDDSDSSTNALVALDMDEIALADGTVLVGHVTPAKDGFTVKHAVIGDHFVNSDAWRWVRRHPAKVEYLADSQPVSVVSTPLIRQPPPSPNVESSRGIEDAGTVFARRMYVWPKTVVDYKLPGEKGGKARVSAALSLAAGSKGVATVRFRIGELTAYEGTLKPGVLEPVVVSFEADAGSTMAFEVDFDKTVRFPCSVTVDDAAVILM